MMQYIHRQQILQQSLTLHQIDGFLVTHNVDLFYLTGSMQTGYLFVPAQGAPIFYVRKSLLRAMHEASASVEPIGSFRLFGDKLRSDFPHIFSQESKSTIATEFDVLPVQQFHRLESIFTNVQWTDGSRLIRELRMIKSPDEISKIQEAARIVNIALQKAVSGIRIGMTELELISIIEHSLRLEGHLGMMRMRGYNQEIITGVVSSGSAAAAPTYFDGPAGGQGLSPASPQGASRKRIERNEPILVDIGCCIDGYVIDQSRTLVIGSLSAVLSHAYSTSESILKVIETQLKPGTICADLYQLAVTYASEAGLSNHFMGYGNDQVKFIGHGIGLEIDELPVLAAGFQYELAPGMVIAVEPKFTFPEQGVVGIEDTYLITDNGYEKLTISQSGLIQIT